MYEQIYAYESLAYYFGMKPYEFWNCEYREVVLFCEIRNIKEEEEFRKKILLEDATSDKIIQADAMSNKNPKIISLKEKFKKIFKK